MKEHIFLLGGQDLEMLEIKSLLNNMSDCLVFDNKLSWENAELLTYFNVIQKYGNIDEVDIYGIELRENDISSTPDNYHRIDHHNDLSAKPSSLEQIAEVLHISLSREQQLIAANDKGYIPAMQKKGATPEEIRQIRLRDRQAQGVTELDELNAQLSISKKNIEGGIVVVKTSTNRFSTICDRLFPYQKLLVYSNKELVYYGIGKDNLTKHFSDDIRGRKMYHGGGNEGFLGTVQGVYTEKQLISLKNEIIQLINQQHIAL